MADTPGIETILPRIPARSRPNKSKTIFFLEILS